MENTNNQEEKNEFEEDKQEFTYELEKDIVIKCNMNRKVSHPDEETSKYEFIIEMACPTDKKIQLHWGVTRRPKISDWITPPKTIYPELTEFCDQNSVNTLFKEDTIKMEFNLSSKDKEIFQYIIFVFHDLTSDKWYNNNGGNYKIELIPPEKSKLSEELGEIDVPNCIKDGMNCEATYGSWCLMMRFQKVRDALFQLNLSDPNESIWIYLWLRYSYRRLLDWQRKFNTPPKDLQWAMHVLTFELTKRFSEFAKNPRNDSTFVISPMYYMKNSLVTIGKGRVNGQLIRDEILNIFHKFNISERIDSFYEQWHQKLHNNTTPDDIVICQALVNFLRTNNIEEYRNTLKYGGVTKERLESFERKIVLEPYYEPKYLPDFENYLKILKEVHGSADLVLMYDQSKYAFGGNDQPFNEILYFKDDWDTLKQIWRVTTGREALQNIINNSINDHGKLRDLLFFDSALEMYLKQLVEKIIHINLEFPHLINEVTAILRNVLLTFSNVEEIRFCLNDWNAIAEGLKTEANSGNVNSAMKVKSVCDRVGRLLGHITDYYNTVFDPRAKIFGTGCNVDKSQVELFTEEEIRSSILFALSVVMKKIEPILRQKANLGPWLIISRGDKEKVYGKVKFEKDLHKVQTEVYKEKTILIVENVGGNEEIPINCSGVIISNGNNYPDMLAHVSVRARNLKVPLIVSFDQGISKKLIENDNNTIELSIVNQSIDFKKVEEVSSLEDKNEEAKDEQEVKPCEIEEKFEKAFIELNEFTSKKVGAKSNNTMKVFNKLPSWIKYPESFAIPFNVNQYFLDLPENEDIKTKLTELISKLSSLQDLSKASPLLSQCKELTMKITFPQDNAETKALKDRLAKFGVNEDEIPLALESIKKVWASKFNERAFISVRKVGIQLNQIHMAVLCQKIIPSEYAFVIHTKNPSNNNSDEVYSELVYGMGETLVGSYEGQSFSYIYNKKTNQYTIQTYPNKSIALLNSGFIFRSDSNTEDLEGFAGAGLFDSVPMVKDKEVRMNYNQNKLFNDAGFAGDIMKNVANLGIEVEKLFNGEPQDIEGVYYNGEYYIIQTRPQV